MKVYVTQGHEEGIGLEVFFKTALMLTSSELSSVVLLAYKDSVNKTLKELKLPYKLCESSIEFAGVSVNVEWLSDVNLSQSFTSLKACMAKAEKGGVLFTLPTSKDQFPGYPGHTEFFRHHYQKSDLGMFFSSPQLQVLLLSDHLPLVDLPKVLNETVIEQRLTTAINTLREWGWPINRILISGFNPHAGENGLIGQEDSRIKNVVQKLKGRFDMSGPWPSDTMLLEQRSTKDLLVYVYHDQGLGVFKGLQGFIGSNITLGLPFPRVSPDHGTSFSLFGKNQADYRGCAFALKQAIQLLKGTGNGQNTSYQSKGSQP